MISLLNYSLKKFLYINTKRIIEINNLQDFKKFKRVRPKTIKDIFELNDYVRLKILKKCINPKC